MNYLLSDNDLEVYNENIDEIYDRLEEIRKDIFPETSIEKKRNIINDILTFLKQKKRKIYGGYALNELLLLNNSPETIYEDGSVNDIDFYTTDPINDIIDICDILQKKKYGNVKGTEAIHKETFSVFVDNELYCDISYVPKNIYNKMPFKERNGLYIIHPHFMWIDQLRVLTDPINSWFRIKKVYTRFFLLQKYFNLPTNLASIEIDKNDEDTNVILHDINEFLVNKESTITIGFYAYNYLLKESNFEDDFKNNKVNLERQRQTTPELDYVDIPFFEFISTNYKDDVLELINRLKKIFKETDITHLEFYPFFQYIGYNTNIYFRDILVAKIYSHNKRCIPYKEVRGHFFCKNKKDHYDMGGKMKIGTFFLNLLHVLINVQRSRVTNNNEHKELYYILSSHLIFLRNYYFLNNKKKTVLDDTVFEDLVIKCTGSTISPFLEKQERILKNKAKNKRFVFAYYPDRTLEKRPVLIFSNSSGNRINNEKNLRLKQNEFNEDDTDENEDIEDNTEILN